ncbi:N-methylglutamate synthase subunit A [Mycolicibacterium phlei]|jgi:glutamate synthase domain-containing protein 1|uniref:glutamine--fructose-6-phosphate transaminase (isomerizing) n=1 Tax=Mycolicibacterium phlei DSM 43239 = CCUG 21000 TaxID=1226750 RepID=A0A5N5VE48_MYCPH|nr:glutamine amidotransferase [Mycolicibacterium phlei]VEG07307.1 N-methylglutamate synthase subunit A [Mycobacteroides chelonae]AMO59175.1 Glutamine--fructose-6-phosphate aminotransferase [Mycolicibacterium phlei]EID13861.1 Glutamine amidotransferases class-II [Mycolicibacterium phlei RIVM601174]KAB7759087.1 glutamine amidotransferase [Mycolicibacterium phlei DSM 43239 = CCUG 21000]KXW59694.1 glutamine amidotransferase [Mycolicibacterium phlei DSM 43072]
MCGIVGLHLRNPDLYPRLGELLTGMLCEMGDRGSDSAGVAVYGDPTMTPPGQGCVSVLEVEPTAEEIGLDVRVSRYDETYLVTGEVDSQVLHDAVRAAYPDALIAGFGADMAVLKGVGHPQVLTENWGLAKAQGWQGVGHTRMATESAVTPAGCHPYAVGPEQCMVHNGSFANHATIRRELRAAGVRFDSENDTEVGARFIAQQLAAGRDVETALKELCAVFDGFYTLLVSNRDSFAVVRDAIACKPAVIAETGDWVAMASEYRALAGLPGVEAAKIWEPEPEVVYAWTR